MMKRFKGYYLLLALLALLLLPQAALAAAWSGEADTSWYDPGAAELEIATPEQLAGLGLILQGTDSISRDDFAGKTIRLTADLDLGGVQAGGKWSGPAWQPLGLTYSGVFAGVFDGGGHKISNIYVAPIASGPSQVDRSGLFVRVSGEVRDLEIASGWIEAATEDSWAGSITSMLEDGGKLSRCVNRAQISGGGNSAGGLVGIAKTGSQIIACANYGQVAGGYELTGGICGALRGGVIYGSFNSGEVRGNTNNMSVMTAAGGLAGTVEQKSRIADSYNLGSVYTSLLSGKGGAGGLAGRLDNSLIINCFSSGAASGDAKAVCGSLVGVDGDYLAATEAWLAESLYNCYALQPGEAVPAAKLGSLFTASGLAWQQGAALPEDEAETLDVAAIVDCSSDGFTVIFNGVAKYSDFAVKDIVISAKAGGKQAELAKLTSQQQVVAYNGGYATAVHYSFLTLGGNRSITYTAAYKEHAPKTASFTSAATARWLDYPAVDFAGGSGTAADPYQIATPEQLARLAYLGTQDDKTYRWYELTQDISLAGKRWEAAGFCGSFDGQGHSISGLTGTSLFGNLQGDSNQAAAVLNLTLLAPQVKYDEKISERIGRDNIAGILANSASGFNLVNVQVQGGGISAPLFTNVGGLLGHVSINQRQGLSAIIGCQLLDVQVEGGTYVGGLAGDVNSGNADAGTLLIQDCQVAADISGISSVGGLIGDVLYTGGIHIKNTLVQGSLNNPNNSFVGGLVGRIHTDSAQYMGADGVIMEGCVVALERLDAVGTTGLALTNNDLKILVGAGKAEVARNFAAADMLVQGAAPQADAYCQLATASQLQQESFWAQQGYDFSSTGRWQWDAEAKAPRLKGELAYPEPDFAQQPCEAVAWRTQPACFAVKVRGGYRDFAYQWQYSVNGGSWQNIAGAEESLLELAAGSGYGSGLVRCQVTDAAGRKFYSEPAALSISFGDFSAERQLERLLAGYHRTGVLANPYEAAALAAAGIDLNQYTDKLDYYIVYNQKTTSRDQYAAMLDCMVMGKNLREYSAIGDMVSESWDWFQKVYSLQSEETGLFSGNNLVIINSLESYFGGAPWGNEDKYGRLGRNAAIAATLAQLGPDNEGRISYIWGSLPTRTGNNVYVSSVDEFDCRQAEFVLLMCRLADDPVWGLQARAARDQVLSGIISRIDNDELLTVRSAAETVSALVAAADSGYSQKERCLALAKGLLEEQIGGSLAIGGGYSNELGQHDMQADQGVTALVLLALADYQQGRAFMAEYVCDVPAELAVEHELELISFPASVSQDLELAKAGALGCAITWESDQPETISPEGRVTRGAQRQQVRLTATATKGEASASRSWLVPVRALGADDADDVQEAVDAAIDSISNYTEIVADLELPEAPEAAIKFSWSSDKPQYIGADGSVTRPGVGSANQTVRLTLTGSKGGKTYSRSQDIIVWAANDMSTDAGKIKEVYAQNRASLLAKREINGYWAAFGAYALLGDYISDPANGFQIIMPRIDSTWYGTQYGAMVMGICAIGENPYNYRNADWVELLNRNYGGAYAGPLYSALGMEAAGADPAVYTRHSAKASMSGTSQVGNTSMGIDIAGWAAVLLAEKLGDPAADARAQGFVDYLKEERPITADGNFANSNSISTNCGLLGLTALYWGGLEEANPLAATWRNPQSGKSIVDATFDSQYGGQDVVTYTDLYNVLYQGGKPAWLALAVSEEKLERQLALAEAILAEPGAYSPESVAAVEAAYAAAKAIPLEQRQDGLITWGKIYYDLYDAVRYAQ